MLRLLRIPDPTTHEAPISAEELELLVETSHKAGVLEASERELLTNVFDFSDLTVRQVMVPRADVVAVPIEASLDAVLDVCVASPHSRILVYEGSVDEIIGIIHLKDLLRGVRSPGRQFDLRSSMHQPRFVPESMEVARLLGHFKEHRSTIAVVVDEFGGTAGLVTLDDLVDELIGDMPDELDVARGGVEQLTETSWRLSPRLRIDELEAMLGDVIPDTEEAETVSGLLQERLGRIAEINDAVMLPGHVLIVEGVDGVRITSLRLERRGEEPEIGNA
jgi:CBS domain containing-hemolysin-like protein